MLVRASFSDPEVLPATMVASIILVLLAVIKRLVPVQLGVVCIEFHSSFKDNEVNITGCAPALEEVRA